MHYEKHLFLNLQSSDYYLFINYIIYLKYIHLKKNILRFKWNIKLWFDENVPHNDDDPSGNMNRPEFSGEKNQRHEIQSAMKQGLGLVIKVPACTIILESGYPFLDGSTATIKLRHPHSPNASVYFDDTTTRNSHDEGKPSVTFFFFFFSYYIDRSSNVRFFRNQNKQWHVSLWCHRKQKSKFK